MRCVEEDTVGELPKDIVTSIEDAKASRWFEHEKDLRVAELQLLRAKYLTERRR